jgi:hypothetical protein
MQPSLGWCSARKKVDPAVIGSMRRKRSGPGLPEHLPEVLVLRGNAGEVRGFFQAHRKMSQTGCSDYGQWMWQNVLQPMIIQAVQLIRGLWRWSQENLNTTGT